MKFQTMLVGEFKKINHLKESPVITCCSERYLGEWRLVIQIFEGDNCECFDCWPSQVRSVLDVKTTKAVYNRLKELFKDVQSSDDVAGALSKAGIQYGQYRGYICVETEDGKAWMNISGNRPHSWQIGE